MEPGSQYDDIMIRYLLKEANREEEAWVLNWMQAGEEKRAYVEELRKTLQLIDLKQEINEIDVEAEWARFRKEITDTKQKVVCLYEAASNDSALVTSAEQAGRTIRFRILRATAIAASLVLLTGLGWRLFHQESGHGIRAGQKATTPVQRIIMEPLMAYVQHEVNTTGNTRHFVLPDGSEVALAKNSELTYKQPVLGNRREIYLTGKAAFKVARDTSRPLTVFSGDISTTALGTQFTVTSVAVEKEIRVRLDEGKVVVRPVITQGRGRFRVFYLLPGQELVYDKSRKSAMVRYLKPVKASAMKNNEEKRTIESPSIPQYRKSSWFMFNNQSLGEIFDALEDMYDTRIIYSKRDVDRMYFIGTFDKGESLDHILKQIASLNNLTVTKTDKAYRIEKKVLKAKG